MKPPEKRRSLSLTEQDQLYFELARLYNGFADQPEDIQKAKDLLSRYWNEGAFTLDHLREQAQRMGEGTDYKTKLYTLIINRFWERSSGNIMPKREFTLPKPYEGEIPSE